MFIPLRNPLKIFVLIFSHRFIPKSGKYGKIEVMTIIYDLFDLDS